MDVFDLKGIITLDSSAFESGLNSARSAASGFGSGLVSAFGKLAKATTAALGAASAAAVGFAKSAVSTGMQFDAMMGQVGATMGKGTEEMTKEIGEVDTAYGHFSGTLRDFALFMGQNTKFSATEAAQALNYMALAGYKTEQSMQMLPSVLNLAAAGAMDLGRASDMITDTQSALGLSFERTNQMVAEFAKAASSGNTTVEMMGEAFLRVGGLAKELNTGIVTLADGTQVEIDNVQQLEIAFTAMANAGVKGAEAGTHMRNMLLKLSNPTKDGRGALEDMGITIFDTEGKMRSLNDIFTDLNNSFKTMSQESKLGIIGDLFNARDTASATALLAAIEGTVEYEGEIYNLSAAYEKWGDDIYDVTKGFKVQASTWDSLGESILGATAEAVTFNGEMYSLEEAYEKWGDDIYDVSKGFKVLNSAEAMALRQNDNLTGSITLFKSALETAKITLSDQLTPALREFVEFGTQGLQEIVNGFNENGVQGAMDAFSGLLSEGLVQVVGALPNLANVAGTLLSTLGQGLLDNIDVVSEAATSVLTLIADLVVKGLPGFLKIGGSILSKIGVWITENADTLFDGIEQAILQVADYISENIGPFFDGIFTLMGKIANRLPNIITPLMRKLPNAIRDVADAIVKNAPTIIQGATDTVVALAGELPSILSALVEKAPEILSTVGGALINNAGTLINCAIDLVGKLVEDIPELLTKLLTAIPDIITEIFNPTDGFLSADNIEKMITKAIEIVGKIVDAIPRIIAALIGAIPGIITSICAAFGIDANDPESLAYKLKGVFETAMGLVVPVFDQLKEAAQMAFDFIVNVFDDPVGALESALTKIGNNIRYSAKTIKEEVLGLVEVYQNYFEAIGAEERAKTIREYTKKLGVATGKKLIEENGTAYWIDWDYEAERKRKEETFGAVSGKTTTKKVDASLFSYNDGSEKTSIFGDSGYTMVDIDRKNTLKIEHTFDDIFVNVEGALTTGEQFYQINKIVVDALKQDSRLTGGGG